MVVGRLRLKRRKGEIEGETKTGSHVEAKTGSDAKMSLPKWQVWVSSGVLLRGTETVSGLAGKIINRVQICTLAMASNGNVSFAAVLGLAVPQRE